MKYNYYYNNVPGKGLCRNNLIYTSLISGDKKTFVQWYYNDTEYHAGKNQVVDPEKMEEKWQREIKFLQLMHTHYPEHIPNIIDIDTKNKKIFLEIEDVDFWELSNCNHANYTNIVSDWQEQMCGIFEVYKALKIHKYSLHPSSYFVVDGKLKSINYFFTYEASEPLISISDVESHIYITRQNEMRKHLEKLGIDWCTKQAWTTLDKLCYESFRTDYPDSFINKCLQTIA